VFDLDKLGLIRLTLLYADPGSGMLVWQLLTAVFLGSLFHLKTIVRRVREAIRNRREDSAVVGPNERS